MDKYGNKNENELQPMIIKAIKDRMENVIILKNDAGYTQGFPDLTILYKESKYAILETKKDEDARFRPNQEFYLEVFGLWRSFARKIDKENMQEVLNELFEFFGV